MTDMDDTIKRCTQIVVGAMTDHDPVPPPASPAEPVAWRVKDFADGWVYYATEMAARGASWVMADALIQPLYLATPLAPAATDEEVARVVEALTARANRMDDLGSDRAKLLHAAADLLARVAKERDEHAVWDAEHVRQLNAAEARLAEVEKERDKLAAQLEVAMTIVRGAEAAHTAERQHRTRLEKAREALKLFTCECSHFCDKACKYALARAALAAMEAGDE